MTLKEKLRKERPELDIEKAVAEECPSDFNLMKDPEKDEDGLCSMMCNECWAREAESGASSTAEVDCSFGEAASVHIIRMLEVEKIHPHPDNPRNDLGDVTELAGSIKESGIMQNLTVVPGSYGYTVVIGHRRLAAAKLAGLKEVPCVVRAMSEKEQLAVMLSGNMQRSDLTIVEQAGGIQMMLDLGDTVSDVSRQTGLSESTVRRRKNLMKIASVDKLKEAEMRGATLADYEKLLEIKDETKREEVLESIGTNNFAWELKRAIDAQKDAEKIKVLKQYMDAQAVEKKKDELDSEEYQHIKTLFFYESQEEYSKPLGEEGQELFYYIGHSFFSVWRRLTEKQLEAKRDFEEELRVANLKKENKRKELEKLYELAEEQREDFLRSYNYKAEHLPYIASVLIDDNDYYSTAWAESFKIARVGTYCDTAKKVVDQEGENGLFRLLAIRAYAILKKKAGTCYTLGTLEFRKNAYTEKMYDYLEALGYEMSEEERLLMRGGHYLYATEID